VYCVAFKPDDPNILVSCSLDETIKMWDITSGSILSTLRCGGGVNSVQFSPDGQHIVAACRDGGVYLFSLNQQSRDWEIRSESPLRGHRYTPSLSREHFLSKKISTNLVCLSSDGVSCVAFKPDNPNILVSCSWDTTIKMWDLTSGSCLSTLRGHRYVPSLSRVYFLSCFYLVLICCF
jgi:WD40 repeat protein